MKEGPVMKFLSVFLVTLSLLKYGTSFSVPSTPSVVSPKSLDVVVPANPTSAKLLSLLQEKWSGADVNVKDINTLVYSLISSRSSFDPETCINGPFYATCHFIGKTPLWERIGKFANKNLKGQKYTISENDENKVVNYSEIMGNAINLQAYGTFVDAEQNSAVSDTGSSSFLDVLMMKKPLFFPKKNEINKNCPYDYDVTVTGASINLFGQSIEVPISGTGIARLLYADPCLRIFVSPKDTNVQTGGGDWESAGLITVQARIDLIDPTFNDNL